MVAQPSLLRAWQARFKTTVSAYLRAKEEFDAHPEVDEEWIRLRERERMLRGVVRGGAQMLIILVRPFEAKDNTAIMDLEIDYGMPGKRSRPLPGVSPSMSKFLEDNRR